MSAPLLDRLRSHLAIMDPQSQHGQLLCDSIAEIERLNAEIERLRSATEYDSKRLAEIDALDHEFQQARDAAENQP